GPGERVYSLCQHRPVKLQWLRDRPRHGRLLPRKSEYAVSGTPEHERHAAEFGESLLHRRVEGGAAPDIQLRTAMGAVLAAKRDQWTDFCFRHGSLSQRHEEHAIRECSRRILFPR